MQAECDWEVRGTGMQRRAAVGVLLGLALLGTGCGKRVAAAIPAGAVAAPNAAPGVRSKTTIVYVLSQGTMVRHEESAGKVWFSLTPALISAYAPNPATGALGMLADFPEPSGTEADVIVPDPLERFAYVADMSSSVIHGYAVNARNGRLREIAGSPFETIKQPSAMAFTPDGRHLYVASQARNAVGAYAVDPATGELRPVPGSPFATSGKKIYGCCVAVTPDGRYALVADMDSVYSFRIDGKTGALRLMGTVAAPPAAGGMVIDRSGAYAYVVGSGTNAILTYSIDARTGRLALAAVSQMTCGDGAFTLVLTPNERFAYTVEGGDKVAEYRLEDGRFTGRWGRCWPGALGTLHLAVDPSGRFLFAPQAGKAKSLSVWAIDAETGLLHPAPGSPTPLPGEQPEGVMVVTQ